MKTEPGYWMYETSGVLRPAVEAYLMTKEPLTAEQVTVIRAYLRQWMEKGPWQGVDDLKKGIAAIYDRPSLNGWLNDAMDAGIDPL